MTMAFFCIIEDFSSLLSPSTPGNCVTHLVENERKNMPSYALITVSQGWISLSELVDLKQQDRMGTVQVKLS